MVAKAPTTSPRQIAAALRERVLFLRPKEVGQDVELTTGNQSSVWGVVTETAYPDAVASLVALADGSVSLYVSDGSGCIGCGAQSEVRQAAADLLQIADQSLPLTVFTHDVALPPEGMVRCYLLTRAGLRYVQTHLDDINKIDTQFRELYFASQRVLATIERVGAGQSLAQEMRLAHNAIQDSPSSPHDTEPGVQQCLSVGNVVRRLRT